MLSPYAKREWSIVLIAGTVLTIGALVAGLGGLAVLLAILSLALSAFFRDPPRDVPPDPSAFVSPADGRIRSIHRLDYFEPLQGPALCIRIFLSLFDVHVNRSPCHGRILLVREQPGKFLNALDPRSAQVNHAVLTVLADPQTNRPVAAVRQIAGIIARRVVCVARAGDILQKGQRFGIIKFGSTTELYIPLSLAPEVLVELGQHVRGGTTILARIVLSTDTAESPIHAQPQILSQPSTTV